MTETAQADTPAAVPAPRRPWLLPVLVLAGALCGLPAALLLPREWLVKDPVSAATAAAGKQGEAGSQVFYACPMFCTRMDAPGTCPVCGMTLERFTDSGNEIELDEHKRRAINLATEPIERRLLLHEIRTLGIFEPDETRKRQISAWVSGRIDRLYADYTGMEVQKGWHLFELYSPELYSAQDELIAARKATQRPGLSADAQADARRVLQITRNKLRLLGLADEQVAEIEQRDAATVTMTVPAPDSGTVIERMAQAGMYVERGEPVLRMADLSRLWLMVQVHERDIGWVRLGQAVDVTLTAFPGRRFEGRVGFVDPVLDEATRTVRVRVEVANEQRELKPGMYATAVILAALGADGRALAPQLEGDYACPMHPLQRSASPLARCPICGMQMEKNPAPAAGQPLPVWAVPREAVLSTGTRHMVYVEWWVRVLPHDAHSPDEPPPVEVLQRPIYQGYEVQLGPLGAEYDAAPQGSRVRGREYYLLAGGLPTQVPQAGGRPGLRIVTNGQFLLDSQMELTGKPSLLRPFGAAGNPAQGHHGHGG
ncbi:MAG: efflux RND transporter periplasmic adaptor subunit [Planctomycetes bacterium]|nr:efflux RND transporter periplasmic adaptor subunit [Planctomycetota bacterium]